MATVALVYVGGLLLADSFQLPAALLLSSSLALALLAIGWRKARPWLIWPLVFLCGWTNLVCQTAVLSPNDLRARANHDAQIVTVRGTLPITPDQLSYLKRERQIARSMATMDVSLLQSQGRDWKPARGRILVLTPGTLPDSFFGGQTVEVTGVIAPPEGPLAEGLFDYRAYLKRQGIYFQLKAESTNDWALLSHGRPRPISDRFCAWAEQRLSRGLPEEDEALHLLWAMTLGWKVGLTNEIYEPFMRSGTMHIFAISGLHIALISGILVSVLRTMQVSRSWCGIVVVPLIWFYTWVTGWQPSAIRSAIMMTVVIGGWSLRRPSNLLNSLAAAAFIILLWDPQQLFGASFQLSFFCVLSMALLLPLIHPVCERLLSTDPLLPKELVPAWRRRVHGPLRWVAMSMATSLAAWLGSLPLTACYFHLFSPVTLLANLLIVPLSSLALCCNVGTLMCGDWCAWAGDLFNHSAWFWMQCMIDLSHFAEWLPNSYFYVPGPSVVDMVLYYFILIGLITGWLIAPPRRAWTIAGASALALVYFCLWWVERDTPALTILPIDGGLGIYCRARGLGEDLVVDPGTTNSVEMGLAPYLRARGVNHLPALLLSHGDTRHVGGSVLLANLFAHPRVFVSPVRFRSPPYRRILQGLRGDPGGLKTLSQGDRLGPWILLHPNAQDGFSQADDNAVVLHGSFKGTRILLLSDLGPRGQNALLDRKTDLAADIVVTGLPSVGEPLTQAFLEAVHPRLIVVADSDYPASEHARPLLQDRLRKTGIPVLYCRASGAITIRCSEGRWKVSTSKGMKLEGTARGTVPRRG